MTDDTRNPRIDDAPNDAAAPPGGGEAAWWERALNRRDANRLALTALVGVSAASLVPATTACCGGGDEYGGVDDDQIEDALKVQREGGWNVGATDQSLALPSTTDTDSTGGDGWKRYTRSSDLLAVTRPAQEKWRPWESTQLVLSLDQPSLVDALKPIRTEDMAVDYDKGRSIASLVTAAQDSKDTLVIVDLPGPSAVAMAAGLATSIEPVFFFNNWPHPKGVVPAHHTLAALLYYADDLRQKKEKRPIKDLPTALILDANRLSPYADQPDLFDNRYLAQIPGAPTLKTLGVKRVLYVTWGSKDKELDDLNDSLTDYEEAGIKVQLLSTRSFAKAANDPDPEKRTGGYYYGGAHAHHTYFYSHYPLFIWIPGPSYSHWASTPTPPPAAAANRPAYKPTRRATAFSGYKGGASASPVGQVSTRRSSSGGVSWSKRSPTAVRSGYGGGSSGSGGGGGSWGRSRSGGSWGG